MPTIPISGNSVPAVKFTDFAKCTSLSLDAVFWITQDGGDFQTTVRDLLNMAINDPIAQGLLTSIDQKMGQLGTKQDTQITKLNSISDASNNQMTTVAQNATKACTAGNLFAATTGLVSLGATATLEVKSLFLLNNPVGSGKNLLVHSISIASGVTAFYTRYRGPTISTLPTAGIITNQSGSTLTSVAKFYAAPSGVTGGNAELTRFAGPSQAGEAPYNGSILIPPGSSIYYSIQSMQSLLGLLSSVASASANVVWWELPV